MTNLKRLGLCLLAAAWLTGCAQYDNKRGVEAEWESGASQLVKGQTTRAQVLEWLGPPSQVLAMNDETALYYLFERSKGDGLILIVYNRFSVDTRYDRAIFFFDDNDVLTDYATRAGGEPDA